MKAEKYHVLRCGVTGDLPKTYRLYLELVLSVYLTFFAWHSYKCLSPAHMSTLCTSLLYQGRDFCLHACACLVSQSCPVPCDPMNWSLVGSSVLGILQARLLEWLASPFSWGSSQHKDQTWVSFISGRFFTS